MNLKQRIDLFINHKQITRSAFEKASGLSNGYTRNIKENIGGTKLEGILNAFPEINRIWLLTGEGPMLKTSEPTPYNTVKGDEVDFNDVFHMVPLIPVEALAGSLTGVSESVSLQQCRRIPCPVPEADLAIPVSGNSMEPNIPSGSILFIKRINEAAFIPYGHILVVDTENGVVVKRIFPSENSPRHLLAQSINPAYPPFEIDKSCIYGIYRVLGGSFIQTTL